MKKDVVVLIGAGSIGLAIARRVSAGKHVVVADVLRVMAEAVKWGHRDARINSISPGIIITPLANDELNGPRGEGYRKMLDLSPAKRAGTPDEIGTLAHLLMSDDGTFISGSDFLIDGGTTASYHYGELSYLQKSF